MSMLTKDITVENLDQAELPEDAHRPPEGGLRAARELCYLRLLGVDLAVVGPESEQPEGNLTLAGAHEQFVLQALPDQVILFTEQSWGEDPLRQ